jgi:GTP1/Obg family GTP-binding protein
MTTKCMARKQIEQLEKLMFDFKDQKIGIEEYRMAVSNIATAQKINKDVLNHSVKFGQTTLCKEIFVD